MQYVERAIGSVSKTWSSINPATLSGAIDVIVVEHPDGNLACSPFHVRFGKFQILKPSQKKVQVIVNGQNTNIPMKLGDSGEAYFVFETKADAASIPNELISSPVVSAASSPASSPGKEKRYGAALDEPDFLDIGKPAKTDDVPEEYPSTPSQQLPLRRASVTFEERARKLNQKLHEKKIPSKFDNNGDLLLDIEGYKPSKDRVHYTDEMLKQLLMDELGSEYDISSFVKEDGSGNMRILNPYEHSPPASPQVLSADSLDTPNSSVSEISLPSDTTATLDHNTNYSSGYSSSADPDKRYIKTIRLTSEQLHCLDLKYGENDLLFSVDNSRAIVAAKLFLWKWDDPIVISDIDGTITKSDALGHVLTMIGKDWTHLGVATLFTEIKRNGYNVLYLTARGAGQADLTRSYLRSIVQDGVKLPLGPVILSPDRTMAALKREVILKKPEVFKIACLNDLRKLYFGDLDLNHNDNENANDQSPTPFIAGFGNRITDALSYRTVGIPSSRIFTINPEGEVHMELLELAGYRSSYVHINELVDHFFPPVKKCYVSTNEDISLSPTPGSPNNPAWEERLLYRPKDIQFTDANYWREPVPSLDDFSESSSAENDELDKFQNETQLGAIGKISKSQSPGGLADFRGSDQPKASFSPFQDGRNNGRHASPPDMALDSHSRDLGTHIYLELGSPLSSPRLGHLNTRHVDAGIDRLSISSPSKASTQVSKLNVLNNGHRSTNNQSSSGKNSAEDSPDDEFDEDEFDEDENDDDGDDDGNGDGDDDEYEKYAHRDDEFDEDEFESDFQDEQDGKHMPVLTN
ncbi:LAMI_0E02454g1_1 [Lachancea mirantina]|uniref:LAMI_0E02454g1_1 n=1 Tax=Lachancea mirantina TaxID=1230905 RepID=A0A1G4JJ69_9SACH|nr:LAMI_0E02454g1_1 [Lachancea mirantina]